MSEFEFWKRIDEMRGNTTLNELAEVMDLKEQSLRAMRSQCRYPKRPAIEALARYLNTTADYLMTGNPPVIQKTADAPELKKIIVTLQENPKLMPFVEKYIESIKGLVSDTEEKKNAK